MTLTGGGIEKAIITHTTALKPSTKTLPDPEMKTAGMDTQAYLLRLKDKAANIAISDLTLRGPQLHGAIYGWDNQNCHLHHNTFKVNFSIEFPFEGDEDMEIDHNICEGTISIPKYAGGSVPLSGRTFHIHHNWMRDSYSIEFVRNGVEIDHNLFDFDVKNDGGNLLSSFGSAPAKGPASFHNNLVNNPGRGVVWINEIFNHLEIRNNHIITRTSPTPRKDGLFGLNAGCDFKTISIQDNIIECQGQARPLLRSKESRSAMIRNNQFTNVSDADQYENPRTDARAGLEQPLKFECGKHGEFIVEGWEARRVQ